MSRIGGIAMKLVSIVALFSSLLLLLDTWAERFSTPPEAIMRTWCWLALGTVWAVVWADCKRRALVEESKLEESEPDDDPIDVG